MPETSQPASATSPTPAKRSRPPGEMGGHTVMPWEQDGRTSGIAASPIQAGSDAASPASGGSSKSVPPPSDGHGDGLGQGAGSSTAKAADDRMPPASESMGILPPPPASGKPPAGSAGRPARPNKASKPQDLEQQHPEGAERPARRGLPRTSPVVGRDDAPQDAMAGAPATAFKATPQATHDAPEEQVEGGDATREAKPVTPTLSGSLPKPAPGATERVAKQSAPKASEAANPLSSAAGPRQEGARAGAGRERAPSPTVPSTGADAAKAASGAAAHPTNPAMAHASGQHDPEEDKLIEALDKRLAEMLARALHETVATAVRETRSAPRPPAPPPVQPQK